MPFIFIINNNCLCALEWLSAYEMEKYIDFLIKLKKNVDSLNFLFK